MTATLKRKLAGDHRDGTAPQMTALRALRLSMARAGDDLFYMALAVSGGRQTRLLPDDLAELLVDEDLLVVLDCPGGQTGVAALSLPLVAALIQQQTMGRVLDRPAEAREYTETDAALAAPLLEGVLARAADLAEDDSDRDCFHNIRFGARAEDARSVLLALRAKRYRAFTLTVDIALGLQQARVVLALPDHDNSAVGAADDPDGQKDRAAKSPFLDVEADLRAVLARFRLSVSELNALSIGDTLPLSRERLDDTALVTVNDRVVVRGKLGQMNGHRAVRLMSPQPVPKVTTPTGFEPHLAPREPDAVPELPMEGGLPDAGELAIDDLSTLSTDEAVDQISNLAGFSAEEMASLTETPAVEGEDLQLPAALPAVDLDLGDLE